MVERLEGTSTGEDIVFSFASDNVDRGAEGVDFLIRRPTFPWGDNPRGREIEYGWATPTNPSESYGAKNMVFRAFKGRYPLEGQKFDNPVRVGELPKPIVLRPNLPSLSPDFNGLNIYKKQDRAALAATDFAALFPTVSITTPTPLTTFSRGQTIEIRGTMHSLRNLVQSTLIIDGHPVDRHFLDRRDQDVAVDVDFFYLYHIPDDRASGSMEITIRAFNINVAEQGFIASAARNFPPQADQVDLAKGTDTENVQGQSSGSQAFGPQLHATYLLRTPEAVANISVNIS